FSAGLLTPRTSVPAPFDASLFTATASTAGRSTVAYDESDVDRAGLEYRAVVVQVGDGLPTYDFAMFAQGADSIQFEKTTQMRLSKPGDDDLPPADSMVF
ncbi:MAG TPA: hypothetical protein P5061_07325, partial [Mycobacterium sp.]|nr:hypothetical protein [Mycobacterium sp.]